MKNKQSEDRIKKLLVHNTLKPRLLQRKLTKTITVSSQNKTEYKNN